MVASTALVLAACATEIDGVGEPPADELPAAAEQDGDVDDEDLDGDEPGTSPRGNVVKQLGEEAGAVSVDRPGLTWEDMEIIFAIDAIEVGATCTQEFADPPENGHFLALDVRVSTREHLDESLGWSFLNPYDFSVVGDDGVTETALATFATYGCIAESEELPSEFAPASKYTGTIILDSKHDTGVLVYRTGRGAGWEWEF
jgi:hypothetical protein